MSRTPWAIFIVALGMMAATAGWLNDFRGRHLLGPPGVKVGAAPMYDEHHKLAATQSVILPEHILDMESQTGLLGDSELTGLPRDTTFGRRIYRSAMRDFAVQLSVVLMGTDHTSIHQPQYCLYAQDWTLTKNDRIKLSLPHSFGDIPAVKIEATRQDRNGQLVRGIYVYWFVSGDKVTAEEGSRLWSMWKTMLQKGQMERWAYISYFTTCLPGQEEGTFARLVRFIQASAPEFQLVKGTPLGGPQTLAEKP
jgi:hypothetical protein